MITKVADVRGNTVDWIALGNRFNRFRKSMDLSIIAVANELEVSNSTVRDLESGFKSSAYDGHARKSTNIIWSICQTWDLSLNWLLNGIGKPHDPDPVELLPDTLIVQKGAGIKRSANRVKAEEGRFVDEALEFVMAIDKFRNRNNVPFPTLTQTYEIVLALGYRKTKPARIAPLGYVIERQRWREELKHLQETDEIIRREDEDDERKLQYADEEERQKREDEHRKRKVNASPKFLHDPTLSSKERLRRSKIRDSSICRNIKQYIITDPQGRVYVTDKGLNEFCRQHGLDSNNLGSVATGKRKHHRKWTAQHVPDLDVSAK